MNIVNYVFTNKVSVWGFLWKWFLGLSLVLILGGLGVYVFMDSYFTSSKLTNFLSGTDVKEGISKLMILQTGEYVSASYVSGIQSNKIGSRYSGSDYTVGYYEQDSCESVFNSFRQDSIVILTKAGLCMRSNNKQQVITVEQILSGRMELINSLSGDAGVLTLLKQYSGLTYLVTGESLFLDDKILGHIVNNEFPTILQDEKVISGIYSLASVAGGWALIPLCLMGMFFIAIFLISIAIVWMLYALLTMAVASIFKKPIQGFEQSCSATWLPLLFVSCVLDTILVLPWWGDILAFCVLMYILMSIYFADTKEPGLE